METRILVFPCGSEIGLELHQALKWCKHIKLVGASSVRSNHGKYVYKDYVEDLPFVDAPQFISRINAIVREYDIDFIYPAHDSVVLTLARMQDALACSVIGSPVETCEICRSKLLTYRAFGGKVRVPEVYADSDQIERFPVFLKPDVGQGSKGTFTACSPKEVEFLLSKDPTLLALEFLPGAEFTVDCLTDRKRNLRFAGARKRIRVQNGICVNARPAEDERFRTLAEIIQTVLRFRGAWFFQVKEAADGELALMEIAPRIAGTMGLYRNLGVNFSLLSVYDRLGIDLHIQHNTHLIEMDRALCNRFETQHTYRHVYIDLDDTVVVGGQVNIMIVGFLYQCLNKDIKVHLVSRHSGDLHSVLRKYRLEAVFDTITQLDQTQEKADFIEEPSSIFIDDSFSERQRVARSLNVPTFDLDAVESLLDSRR